MENKKILNTTPTEYNGIKFKSLLEVMVYKTLLQEGFTVLYEPTTYILWVGKKPTVPFYTLNRKRTVMLNLTKLINITYTPDFYLEYNGYKIVIEAKGKTNDVFPYKFKMFRQHLEYLPDKDKYLLFEIFTKKQLLESIKIIKNYGSSRLNEEAGKESSKGGSESSTHLS